MSKRPPRWYATFGPLSRRSVSATPVVTPPLTCGRALASREASRPKRTRRTVRLRTSRFSHESRTTRKENRRASGRRLRIAERVLEAERTRDAFVLAEVARGDRRGDGRGAEAVRVRLLLRIVRRGVVDEATVAGLDRDAPVAALDVDTTERAP